MSTFPAGTVSLVTRLCGMYMEWSLGADSLARVHQVADQLLVVGRSSAGPVFGHDAVYGGLRVDVEGVAPLVGPLRALNGVVFGRVANGGWLQLDSDEIEKLAFAAAATTAVGPAVDWVLTADRHREAFWDSTKRPYPKCPQPHSSYVELVDVRRSSVAPQRLRSRESPG